jgi:hypothetical protein
MKGKFLWFIIIALILCWAAIFHFLCGQTNNIIQAIAITTLVFVTIYYARQTWALVEEGKKKRDANFWERRINEFYEPFIVKLNELKKELHEDRDTREMMEMMNKIWKELYHILYSKGYMTSEKTLKEIAKLTQAISEAEEDRERESYKKYYAVEQATRKIILKEWDELEHLLREFYGVEKKNNEDIKK